MLGVRYCGRGSAFAETLHKAVEGGTAHVAADELILADDEVTDDAFLIFVLGVVLYFICIDFGGLAFEFREVKALFLLEFVIVPVDLVEVFGDSDDLALVVLVGNFPAHFGEEILTFCFAVQLTDIVFR